jgi:hypothetical protein
VLLLDTMVAVGIELNRDLLLDTMVAVTRGILRSHRAPTVAGGIELDHQVLLLAVTRGMLNFLRVLRLRMPLPTPMGTVATWERLSFSASTNYGFS